MLYAYRRRPDGGELTHVNAPRGNGTLVGGPSRARWRATSRALVGHMALGLVVLTATAALAVVVVAFVAALLLV